MMNNDVTDWIIAWFVTNTVATADELLATMNDSYFEHGWMDSFKFITFIMDVEERFIISFNNDEFQDRQFSTIAGLAAIINQKIVDHKKYETGHNALH